MSPKYSSTVSLTLKLDGGGWSAPRPGSFTTGKVTRYPLYRRLGGLHSRSGRLRIISPPPEFDPRTARPLASHYTDWTIPAHNNIWCRVRIMNFVIRRLPASRYFLHPVTFCIPLLSASRYFLHPVTFCIPLLPASRYFLHPFTSCIPLLSASRYFLRPVTFCTPLLSTSHYFLHPVTFCIPLLSASRYFLHPVTSCLSEHFR